MPKQPEANYHQMLEYVIDADKACDCCVVKPDACAQMPCPICVVRPHEDLLIYEDVVRIYREDHNNG